MQELADKDPPQALTEQEYKSERHFVTVACAAAQ